MLDGWRCWMDGGVGWMEVLDGGVGWRCWMDGGVGWMDGGVGWITQLHHESDNE